MQRKRRRATTEQGKKAETMETRQRQHAAFSVEEKLLRIRVHKEGVGGLMRITPNLS
ncbi:hypothetical protein PIB30_107687 [Stylosanthes scabra]|uniref:Uncharacterized protein n=1 Tax=Stylosanthes scabra TaxID=79078 RepID=A0ABU6XY37_9FABA|nr:hypothetical protein [Stylosanthes scabra]